MPITGQTVVKEMVTALKEHTVQWKRNVHMSNWKIMCTCLSCRYPYGSRSTEQGTFSWWNQEARAGGLPTGPLHFLSTSCDRGPRARRWHDDQAGSLPCIQCEKIPSTVGHVCDSRGLPETSYTCAFFKVWKMLLNSFFLKGPWSLHLFSRGFLSSPHITQSFSCTECLPSESSHESGNVKINFLEKKQKWCFFSP